MINKKNRYLIACSGGPDSMALLHMFNKKGYQLEVAHVNHHKRDTAKRDEDIVRDFCKKNNIVFNKLDLDLNKCKGNFQAFARKERYEYFKKICNEHNLDGVLLGHQKDDVIETYLMQKSKKVGVKEYGLAYHNNLYGVEVYRPLLNKSKNELIEYCKKNNVKYGIDESNLEDHYERNKVRHSRVEKMSEKQKDEIIRQIKSDNLEALNKEKQVTKFIDSHKGRYDYKQFIEFPYLKVLLRRIFGTNLSDKYLDEMIRQLQSCKKCVFLRNNIYLVKEYDYIETFTKPLTYSIKIKENGYGDYEYFRIVKKSKKLLTGATVSKDDYPLTIRNYMEGDSIKMKYGTKKVNRFFIDNKISYRQRLTYPVVFNRDGIAILVPGIGSNFTHYSLKNNIYVVLK